MPRTDAATASAYLKGNRDIELRLRFTLGSKFEHNDFTGFEYQPTARLLFTPTNKQSVWAAVSRAVHTPATDKPAPTTAGLRTNH